MRTRTIWRRRKRRQIELKTLIRNRNAMIIGWNTTAKSWTFIRNHTFHFTRGRNCCFPWGRTFHFGSDRTGCTASRGRQHEFQSKRRRNFRQHAGQGSIGGRPLGHECRFHEYIHRWRPISGIGGGGLGNQNPQGSTNMTSTPRSSITRDLWGASIWFIGTSAPGVIGSSATGITGPTSSGITGVSSGILGTSPSGAAGPSLPEPNKETNSQPKRVHTVTIAEGRLRANPEKGSAESTQEPQEL